MDIHSLRIPQSAVVSMKGELLVAAEEEIPGVVVVAEEVALNMTDVAHGSVVEHIAVAVAEE